jgi:hypothetical protein
MKDKEIKEMLDNEAVGSAFMIGETPCRFARADMSDVEHYRSMSNKELEDSFCSLFWIVDIYGQTSVRDSQLLSLMEMEIDKRNSKRLNNNLEKRIAKMREDGKEWERQQEEEWEKEQREKAVWVGDEETIAGEDLDE